MNNKFALIIGNKEYDDPLLRGLRAPAYDVNDLAGLLENPQIGGFQVMRLLDRPFAEVRTTISDFLTDRHVDDTLLVYFSGHGIKSRSGTVYLAVRDTRNKNPAALGIDAHFLRNEMQQCYSQRQVLILDCCYSGAFAKAGAMSPEDTVDTKAEFMGGGFGQIILTATNAVQVGIEADRVIGDSKYSLFTHYLIEGLRTGQADGAGGVPDGLITDLELYEYAYQRVDRTKEQIPQRLVQGQGPPIVIARNPYFGNESLTPPSVSGLGTRQTKIDALVEFVQTRSWLSLALVVTLLGSVLAVVYHFYGIEKQHRADASGWRTEGLEKLRAVDTQGAEKLFLQAVAADPSNGRSHADLAVTLRERGNESGAKMQAQLALDLRSTLGALDRAWVEGIFSEVNLRWDLAIHSYRQLWTSYRDIEAGLRLANAQTFSGKGGEALETVTELRALPIAGADPRVDFQEAVAANSLGKFKQELRAARNMAERSPEGSVLHATALNQQCWAFYKLADLKNAADACDKAVNIFANNGDQLGRARGLTRQSLILAHDDPKSDRAMALQTDALSIAYELNAELDEAGALQNRANLWMDRKNFDKAKDDYEAAALIYRRIGDQRGLASAENDAATSFADRCQYEMAKTGFERARQAFRAIGSQDVAIASSNVGDMLYMLGDLTGAENNLKEALWQAASSGLQLDTASWMVTLGDVFMEENDLSRAEQCFRGMRCYDDSASDRVPAETRVLGEATLDFALLQIESGEPGAAEKTARLEVARSKGSNPDEEAAALDVLARSLIAQGGTGRFKDARDAIATANTLHPTDCTLRASLDITDGLALGYLHQFENARDELANALRESTEGKLLQYQFEARLAQVQTESLAQTHSAREQAKRVSNDAQSAGFRLIARKATQLSGQTKIEDGLRPFSPDLPQMDHPDRLLRSPVRRMAACGYIQARFH